MLSNVRTWGKRRPVAITLLSLTVAGCLAISLPRVAAQSPAHAHLSFALPETLSLPKLLDLAAQNNPELAVIRARADIARGKMIQAGLYLNPTVSIRSDEMGNPNGAGGFLALTITQEFVTNGKLRLAQAAAAEGVAAADWDAVTRWYDVATRVRLAYTDALTAQREVSEHRKLVDIAQQGLSIEIKKREAGAGSEPDVLRARVQLEQSEVQRNVAQRRAEAARRLLAIVVGLQELPLLDLAGDLDVTPPDFAWQPLLENLLGRSSEIQSGMALNAQADRLLARARAEVCPNFYIQVRPIYSFPDRTPEAMVELGARLPLWDRNQGNIAAARADVARTQAEIRQVELSLMARLNAAFQKYQTARQQAQAYNERILRHAQDSLDLVRKAYERGEGKFDYTAVLQAQLILFQARLVYVQTLGEVWRGVSEIAGLLQLDDINVAGYPRQGCPAPAGRPEFLPPPSPPGVGTLPRPAAVPGPNPS